jgi:NADH:ubiquinone oxidoreductase subunit B-like Fe-S oxidoreductase
VLSTFDELVIKNDNDVLLEVYVPGCPACGALMPRIAMLSTLLKAVPTVTIAAMVGAAVMAYAVCLSVYAVAMLFRC